MNRKKFFQTLPKRFTERDRIRIAHAYWLAKETHRRQNRRGTGERYFEHCRRVTNILLANCEEKVTPKEIISALIHDCWEDGFIPQELIRKLFGASVARALDALSKTTLAYDATSGFIRKTRKSNREYYRAITQSPPWVRRIKIADRIDNLKDIRNNAAWIEEKRCEYTQETKHYIFPIAETTDTKLYHVLKERLGI